MSVILVSATCVDCDVNHECDRYVRVVRLLEMGSDVTFPGYRFFASDAPATIGTGLFSSFVRLLAARKENNFA